MQARKPALAKPSMRNPLRHGQTGGYGERVS